MTELQLPAFPRGWCFGCKELGRSLGSAGLAEGVGLLAGCPRGDGL